MIDSLPPPRPRRSPVPVGVSGFALRLPPYRVLLDDWCDWTGASADKIRSTVGRSFRVLGPLQNLYTLAAGAVLELIVRYDVDPRTVGYLALGTESSSDNSAGAIIVKGMVDRALERLGRPRISRHCEVPELKHACLGGVYALKGALRYLATDGAGRRAIAVSADVAEYERGSSGEPTQGAGAVAQLVEENPKLYEVDLREAASAAAYRGVDFRKPHGRRLSAAPPPGATRLPDYPVFNGKYSTICYTDEALHAVARLLRKIGLTARELFHRMDAAFFHRPYHRLTVNVLAALYVWGLTRDPDHHPELAELCAECGAEMETVLREAEGHPDLFRDGELGEEINREVYPEAMKVVKHFRRTKKFREVEARKIRLGADAMRDLGNLYTASLPAWIAAGFEEGLSRELDLGGKAFLTVGYGSGDAAEAGIIRVAEEWREAAARIGFADSCKGAIDLGREQYEALHDGRREPCPARELENEFVVDRVGDRCDPEFCDRGIEYTRYVPAGNR
ncbi:MAG: hydroxymethylglutaryl-CoA synthase [Polyangia bacterium]